MQIKIEPIAIPRLLYPKRSNPSINNHREQKAHGTTTDQSRICSMNSRDFLKKDLPPVLISRKPSHMPVEACSSQNPMLLVAFLSTRQRCIGHSSEREQPDGNNSAHHSP
jgi:hypothetical protein